MSLRYTLRTNQLSLQIVLYSAVLYSAVGNDVAVKIR
jgi:hypothetical protein